MDYRIDSSDQLVEVFADGVRIGFLSVLGGSVDQVAVAPLFRRQGVATQMLELARGHFGTVAHAACRSDDGDAWALSFGEVLPERISDLLLVG